MWANEIFDMGKISRKALFVELPAIETIDEQTNGTFKGIRTAGKTPEAG